MTGSGRRLPSVVSFPFGSFWKRFCTQCVVERWGCLHPIPFMYAWFTSVRTQQSMTKQNKWKFDHHLFERNQFGSHHVEHDEYQYRQVVPRFRSPFQIYSVTDRLVPSWWVAICFSSIPASDNHCNGQASKKSEIYKSTRSVYDCTTPALAFNDRFISPCLA